MKLINSYNPNLSHKNLPNFCWIMNQNYKSAVKSVP